VNILEKLTTGFAQTSGFGEGIKTSRPLYVTGKFLLHYTWSFLGHLQSLNLGWSFKFSGMLYV